MCGRSLRTAASPARFRAPGLQAGILSSWKTASLLAYATELDAIVHLAGGKQISLAYAHANPALADGRRRFDVEPCGFAGGGKFLWTIGSKRDTAVPRARSRFRIRLGVRLGIRLGIRSLEARVVAAILFFPIIATSFSRGEADNGASAGKLGLDIHATTDASLLTDRFCICRPVITTFFSIGVIVVIVVAVFFFDAVQSESRKVAL